MLNHQKRWKLWASTGMLLLPLLMLSGCGGGGGGSAPATTAPPTATLSSIAVTPANASLGQNATQQFTATGTYSDDTSQNLTTSVTWSSSNTTTATISNVTGSQGLVTALAIGTTTITASLGNITESTFLTVTTTVGIEPVGLAIDAAGNIWVTNQGNNSVTELTASGAYKNGTLANSSFLVTIPFYLGALTAVEGIAIDASGNVWVASDSGGVTELAASGAYKNGTLSNSTFPANGMFIAIDASGNVWVVGLSSSGNVVELTASGAYKNGTLANSSFTVGINPGGIAIDAAGNVWVTSAASNSSSNNGVVTELTASGAYKNGTLANSSFTVGFTPQGIAIDAAGNVWVSNYGSNTVMKLNSLGAVLATYPVGTGPFGIAIDAAGNVWAANTHSNNVTELSNSGATGPQYFPYSGPQWPTSGL